jgi:SAM-dependent MidA family methyltransferase
MDADVARRPAETGATVDASDRELVQLIRDEIARTGPITVARFMERALYEPELGYYRRAENPADRGGDFLTAPELHPIFGATLARAVASAWRSLGGPTEVTVREYGAGSGALARSILQALAAEEPDMAAQLRYEAVEINDGRRDALEAPLVGLRPGDASRRPPRPTGIVLANELLDAFPVHVVEGAEAGGLKEVFVDRGDGRFVERLGAPSTPSLAQRLHEEDIALQPGQRGEINLGLDAWFGEVAVAFERSVAILIDYGYDAADLYAPHRRRGTLLGYRGQAVVDDPYANVGRQDLTAHVDFTAVERAAARHGMTMVERTTQARFLVANGLEELLEQARNDPQQSLGEYLELRSGLVRLIDPLAMGGFRVIVLGKGLATAPQAGIG